MAQRLRDSVVVPVLPERVVPPCGCDLRYRATVGLLLQRVVAHIAPCVVEHRVDDLHVSLVVGWGRAKFGIGRPFVLVYDAGLDHQRVVRDGVGLLFVTDLVAYRLLVGGDPVVDLLVVVVVSVAIGIEVGLPVVVRVLLGLGDVVNRAVPIVVELFFDLGIELFLGLFLQLFLQLGCLEVVGHGDHLNVEDALSGDAGRAGRNHAYHEHALLGVLVGFLGERRFYH